MLVKAKDGVKVPVEGHPRRYISDSPVEVEGTAYYRRRLREGDLVPVTEPIPATTTKARKVKEA